jgi:hypothetical protein
MIRRFSNTTKVKIILLLVFQVGLAGSSWADDSIAGKYCSVKSSAGTVLCFTFEANKACSGTPEAEDGLCYDYEVKGSRIFMQAGGRGNQLIKFTILDAKTIQTDFFKRALEKNDPAYGGIFKK